MKTHIKLFIAVFFFSLYSLPAISQFKKASVQASGLTCAMCSRAIYNALAAIPFVDTVVTDIERSTFEVTFKPQAKVDIDALKEAVEGAGFSVARFSISANFNNLVVRNDEHVELDGNTFHFLKVKSQTLNGDHNILLVDKHFLSAKEFKKYSSATQMKCVQTGRAASCCSKQQIAAEARIYHATI